MQKETVVSQLDLNEDETFQFYCCDIQMSIENNYSQKQELTEGILAITDQRIFLCEKEFKYGVFFCSENIIAFGNNAKNITLSLFDESQAQDFDQEQSQEQSQEDDILSIIKEMLNGECKNLLRVIGNYEIKFTINQEEQVKEIYNYINEMKYEISEDQDAPDGWNMDEMITAEHIDEEGNINLKKVKTDNEL